MMAKTGAIARKIGSTLRNLVSRLQLYETFQIYAIGHARLLKGLWEIKERLVRASGLLGSPDGLITDKIICSA